MAYDKFLIAPFNSGLQTDMKPWRIMDDAFERLNNAYVYRGRVKKKYGSSWMGTSQLTSRVRVPVITSVNLGPTNNFGNLSGSLTTPPFVADQLHDKFIVGLGGQVFEVDTLGTAATLYTTGAGAGTLNTTTGAYVFTGCAPLTNIYYYQVSNNDSTDGSGDADGIVPGGVFKIGQQFSIGTEIFTVYQLGTPGDMYTTGSSTLARFNTTTGEYFFTGATPSTAIYFYPAEPIMGITQYETNDLGNNPTYAFDTQFTYTFNGTNWVRSGVAQWHPAASTSNFFWSSNWLGEKNYLTSLFVSNFQCQTGAALLTTDDSIKTLDITTNTWSDFTPRYSGTAGKVIITAKIIVPFKNRLLLFNTKEVDNDPAGTYIRQYQNRCRFSHEGSPFFTPAGSGVVDHPWLEPNQSYVDGATYVYSGGGFTDAPTQEEIISIGFIKDHLIVYFERSAWEVVGTNNPGEPFIWQKFNSELGSIAAFSTVSFDKLLFTIGGTGVHICNGSNVERIDDKIPDQVFTIRTDNDGLERVNGIRDFYTEMVYWSYPADNAETNARVFPNKVLVYNYKNNSWATNDDTITAMGYFEQQTAPTWASTITSWEETLATWASGVNQSRFRQILAGNQQGFIVILDPFSATNAPSLCITNIQQAVGSETTLTVVDHTLNDGEYIKISNTGIIELDDFIFPVTTVGQTATSVPMTTSVINIGEVPFTGTYLGGGTISRVSKIDILTKRFNPYLNRSKKVFISDVKFAVDKTESGAITVDHWVSSSKFSMLTEAINNNVTVGTGVLETFPYPNVTEEALQDLLWHRVYLQSEGQFVQLRLFFSNSQMTDKNIVESNFELEGFILSTSPRGEL